MNLRTLVSSFAALFIIAPTVAGTTPSPASDDKEYARSVMAASLASDDGFHSSVANMTMQMTDRAGRSSQRKLEISTLERGEEGIDKSIIRFIEPIDIANTMLLSHTARGGNDFQWLYIPTLKRVKRLSSANRSGPFVSSEFAFEDLTSQEIDRFEYAWHGTEACSERQCNVLVRTPTYTKSGYSKQLIWVDTQDQQVRQVDYYDRTSQHKKTLTLGDYRNYDGVWRAHDLLMVNHLTGKQTRLVVDSYDFQVALAAREFESGALRQGR